MGVFVENMPPSRRRNDLNHSERMWFFRLVWFQRTLTFNAGQYQTRKIFIKQSSANNWTKIRRDNCLSCICEHSAANISPRTWRIALVQDVIEMA
jgi:hypothetical protein